MRVDELVGYLQTYEMTLLDSQKPKESTFKASKNEKRENENFKNIEIKELALMSTRIKLP